MTQAAASRPLYHLRAVRMLRGNLRDERRMRCYRQVMKDNAGRPGYQLLSCYHYTRTHSLDCHHRWQSHRRHAASGLYYRGAPSAAHPQLALPPEWRSLPPYQPSPPTPTQPCPDTYPCRARQKANVLVVVVLGATLVEPAASRLDAQRPVGSTAASRVPTGVRLLMSKF